MKLFSIANCKVFNYAIQKNALYIEILLYFAVLSPFYTLFITQESLPTIFACITDNSFLLSQVTKQILSDWEMNESVSMTINLKRLNRLVALI